MKNIIQQLMASEKKQQKAAAAAQAAKPENSTDDRRSFLKKTALGGLALGGFMFSSLEDTIAQSTSKVNRASKPSDLKITDMRYAIVHNGTGRNPILRIDTNQGIYGLGEVRDGADERYALFLKSRILGMNPCNVEMIFKTIKQFGYHGRQGGGVCGVEMALWDLAGKAYNVPAYQLLGGQYRDKVRLYADTPEDKDISVFKEKVRRRMEDQGFTWLKMDLGVDMVSDIPGSTVNSKAWPGSQWQGGYMSLANTRHPFTQIQLNDKGLDGMAKYVDSIRSVVGYEIPLSSDHFGHFDKNNCIRLGKALDKYRLAWLEDMIPWQYTDDLKEISGALETPVCTGEDIFLKEEFIKLIDNHSVDIIHPDLATSGGLLETKKIGDYAEEKGVAMAMHFAGTPVCFMANVHCAAATQNFLALEHHSVDVPWWKDLVRPVGKKPLIEKGFANVPDDAPGLGIELNEEEFKKHLIPTNKSYFAPTPEWDDKRSHDRIWS